MTAEDARRDLRECLYSWCPRGQSRDQPHTSYNSRLRPVHHGTDGHELYHIG